MLEKDIKLMNVNTEVAKRICLRVHEGQFDKAGEAYYKHPFAIAEMVDDDKAKQVAYLHDAVEDSEIGIEYLIEQGFDEDVVMAIEAISKRPEENYDDYIKRVKLNKLASSVKIKDMMHNANVLRYSNPTKEDIKRCKKYLTRLENFINNLDNQG